MNNALKLARELDAIAGQQAWQAAPLRGVLREYRGWLSPEAVAVCQRYLAGTPRTTDHIALATVAVQIRQRVAGTVMEVSA